MAQRDGRQRFLNLLDSTWPGLRDAFLTAFAQVRSQVALGALEDAIRRGDVQAALDALRLDENALFALDAAMEGAYRTGGQYQLEAVAAATARFPQGARIVQSFGGRNERAERWAREVGSGLIREIIEDQRTAIRETIEAGLVAGRNPRGTALDIAGRMDGPRRKGGIVGLHSQQAGYVRNMQDDVRNLDARYFTRERRDKRFDATVRRAIKDGKPLAQADMDRITGRYADRLLASRAETIARTETLSALNAGRMEGLQQLMDAGRITADQVQVKWDSTADGRTRPTHAAADGQTVPFGQPFTVGGHRMLHPGDTSLGAPAGETVNCRCYAAPVIDFYKGLR